MLVYLRHPDHGVHIVYNDIELAECKSNGWVEQKAECDDDPPCPQPVAASAPVAIEAPQRKKRGPYKKRKAA